MVVLGEMILVLYDAREDSATRGRLEVVRMEGARYEQAARREREDVPTYLIPIPPGVYHCIGNMSDRPFVLTNFPTELYDPGDEGRVPFLEVRVASIDTPFDWDLVAAERHRK
ncbi:MAG: hypothetical protein ACRDV4_09215 [Acidimicrobiales bacterium]